MQRLVAGIMMLVFASCTWAQQPAREDALDNLGWKLGCQAWTFKALSLMETLDTLKKLDIHYLEIYPGQRFSQGNSAKTDHNMTDAMIAILKAKLTETNVTAMSYGVVNLTNSEAQDRKVFEFAKQLGLTTIVSEPPENAIEMLDRLCLEYRINLAIHDHPSPNHYWNPDTVLKVCTGRSDRVGACADVGHWRRSGLVPVECLKKLEGRIIELHFKDINENKEDVPWGQGTVDIAACMAEIKRQKIKPLFSIEYERTSGEELIANVTKSIRYFKEEATKLAK